jgi:methylase of polypeptide subunit release factors
MQVSPLRPAPSFSNPDDYKRVRDTLSAAEYSEAGIARAVCMDKFSTPRTGDPILMRRTQGGSALDTLIRLFLLDVPVEIDAARRAVQRMTLESWIDAGLIRLRNGSAVASVKLTPYKGLIIAHDFRKSSAENAPDFVMGIGGATLTLASITVRRPAKAALDLGTGSGILAFLASRHCDRVYAVDRNERAVAIADFNKRLNAITNVECRAGNLFEPVQGLDFDLVFADPPYIVSPQSDYLYLHGGTRGDEFCRSIVRDVPAYLTEGGYYQMLFNWPHISGRQPAEDLAGWFQGTGCDAWLLRISTEDPPEYANTWIQHMYPDDEETGKRLFNQWMDFYEREKIEAISSGLVTMRRKSSSQNWFSMEDAPEKVKDECGNEIAERFERHDYLAVRSDQDLLESRLRCSPDLRLHHECEPGAGDWRLTVSELRLKRGLTFHATTDPFIAGLVVRCDGQARLGELLAELAEALGAEAEKMMPHILTAVRQLVDRGFLVPETGQS